eukprot:1159145-Pelagomonas_calceolata.AAC.12
MVLTPGNDAINPREMTSRASLLMSRKGRLGQMTISLGKKGRKQSCSTSSASLYRLPPSCMYACVHRSACLKLPEREYHCVYAKAHMSTVTL